MARGDVVAAIGWSGDAIQLQADNPDIKFVMPEQGCIIWADNMVIPVGAPNPAAAYEWMNYVYEPKNQAQIANYNYYTTPVAGVKPYLRKINPEADEEPADLPDRAVHEELLDPARSAEARHGRDREGVPEPVTGG